MSKRGYIRFHRSIFGHPVFRNEPFTEREAWTWLLVRAAWKPLQQRLGEHLINLERGEVVGAVRYLATEWQWSKGKVERFLERLKNEAMIETKTGTGITVITVCNYNEYQSGDDDDGTEPGRAAGNDRDAAGTAPGQRRDGGGDNRKELNTLRSEEGKEGEIDSGATLFGTGLVPAKLAEPNFGELFRQWYAVYPKKVDPKDAEKCFIRVLKSGKATFDELLVGARRYAAEEAGTEKRFIKAPSVWLNKGSWLNEPKAPVLQQRSRADSMAEGILAGMMVHDRTDT